MSEITKLYENAEIKKINTHQSEIDNGDPRFTGISHSDSYIKYPPFTAEKQMLLLDFLSKYEITIINESNTPYYMIYTHDKVGSVKANNIGELMAKYINMFIWQGLTEEEKQQVKGILE